MKFKLEKMGFEIKTLVIMLFLLILFIIAIIGNGCGYPNDWDGTLENECIKICHTDNMTYISTEKPMFKHWYCVCGNTEGILYEMEI